MLTHAFYAKFQFQKFASIFNLFYQMSGVQQCGWSYCKKPTTLQNGTNQIFYRALVPTEVLKLKYSKMCLLPEMDFLVPKIRKQLHILGVTVMFLNQ
jgi:hypothetical protein